MEASRHQYDLVQLHSMRQYSGSAVSQYRQYHLLVGLGCFSSLHAGLTFHLFLFSVRIPPNHTEEKSTFYPKIHTSEITFFFYKIHNSEISFFIKFFKQQILGNLDKKCAIFPSTKMIILLAVLYTVVALPCTKICSYPCRATMYFGYFGTYACYSSKRC